MKQVTVHIHPLDGWADPDGVAGTAGIHLLDPGDTELHDAVARAAELDLPIHLYVPETIQDVFGPGVHAARVVLDVESPPDGDSGADK